MTTIAWDGRTMAADRLSTGHRNPVCKLHRLPDGGIVGGAGQLDEILRAVEWLQQGGVPADKPKLADDCMTLLMVDGRGKAWTYHSALHPVPILLPFYAVGSGSDYAMAAMACEKDAADAIRIAARFDHNTGVGIDVAEALSELERNARAFGLNPADFAEAA